MFDEFRMNFLRELVCNGIDDKSMEQVMHVIDKISGEYDITRKETSLVPMNTIWQHTVMEYLACRALEGLSKQTLYNYKMALGRFVASLCKPIELIRPNDIRAYLYQYQQERGISNRSLDKLRSTVQGFFKWAVEEGRIDQNPSLAIKPIKYIAKPKVALTQLELEYIREACGDIREKAIIETFYSTGCRVSELCNMRKYDVDWQNMTIQVFGKGGKYRTVFLNAKAFVTLKKYLDSRDDNDDHLFVSIRRPHQGLSRYMIERIVKDISDRAFRKTGKKVTPHIFRHTTATTALQNGMPVQNVSKMLGHERIETTMVYAEVAKNDVQRDHKRYVV